MTDDLSVVFTICKDLCIYASDRAIDYQTLLKRVLARGYKEETLNLMIDHYNKLNVIMVNADENKIILIDNE